MARKPEGAASQREAGLRRLAADGRERAGIVLLQAFAAPRSLGSAKKTAAFGALIDGVAASMPPDASAFERAAALWRLIQHEIDRIDLHDERIALSAAFQLDPTNPETSIDSRLTFARDRGDFGTKPSGRPHGYDALRRWWGEGVRLLSHVLDQRLEHLQKHPAGWHRYFKPDEPMYREPSRGAQPVFAELFVVTVFMKGRRVERRITERLVTAQADDVEYYTARALPESNEPESAVPVRALWGCRAEMLPSRLGEPVLTRLWFPAPLQRGERHYFSSESNSGDAPVSERRAINVEVDHHGIAPGQYAHDALPISGLTIRIGFDVSDLPEAVWSYANVTERERYEPPAPGDERELTMTSQGFVQHTFAEPCQPLAHYGLSFGWPMS
jgi:hypothetical protein